MGNMPITEENGRVTIAPLKYPCTKKSPNLFLQKFKQQHLDKLKKVKTPWLFDGASIT